jgi:hypothetical protein
VGLLSVAIVVALTLGNRRAAALKRPLAALLFVAGAVAAPLMVLFNEPWP